MKKVVLTCLDPNGQGPEGPADRRGLCFPAPSRPARAVRRSSASACARFPLRFAPTLPISWKFHESPHAARCSRYGQQQGFLFFDGCHTIEALRIKRRSQSSKTLNAAILRRTFCGFIWGVPLCPVRDVVRSSSLPSADRVRNNMSRHSMPLTGLNDLPWFFRRVLRQSTEVPINRL